MKIARPRFSAAPGLEPALWPGVLIAASAIALAGLAAAGEPSPPESVSAPAPMEDIAGSSKANETGAKPEPKRKKAKKRTLKEMIELAMEKGKEKTIGADLAELLGFGPNGTPEKSLRYEDSQCPDKLDRTFGVALRKTGSDGKAEPSALVLYAARADYQGDDMSHLDGFVFRATLEGKLEKAIHSEGKPGSVEAEVVPIDRSIRRKFGHEKDFYLKVAPSLGLEFAE